MMERHLLEMRYFETYYFANVVQGVVEDEGGNYLRGLEGWGGDINRVRFITPFPSWSHLHDFIYYLINQVFHERQCVGAFDKHGNRKRGPLYIDRALAHYNKPWHGFDAFLKENGKTRDDMDEDDVFDYMEELLLCGPYEDLVEHITEEVFHVTFLNRELLHRFNHLASIYVGFLDRSMLEPDQHRRLSRDGVLSRVKIPRWVQRAVFYRDRGRCVYCNLDLSSLITTQNNMHFDHIVPLKRGGLNDVSNLQLLCDCCNLKKGGKGILASRTYERWYKVKAGTTPPADDPQFD